MTTRAPSTPPPPLHATPAVQKALAAAPSAVLIARDGARMRRHDTGETIAMADVEALVDELRARRQRVLVAYEPTVLIPGGCPLPPTWPPPPDWFDECVVADSAGKDSRVLTHDSVQTYGPERVTLVYNILGNEHPRAVDEFAAMARHYGVRAYYTWRDRGGRSVFGATVPPGIRALYAHDFGVAGDAGAADDADDHVVRIAETRGQWPSPIAPLCTSSMKRDPSDALLRALPPPDLPSAQRRGRRRVFRTGERAAESASRAKKPRWQTRLATPTRASLTLWERPLLQMRDADVWAYHIQHGIPAPASYWGLSRYSCVACIYKSFAEHVLMCLTYRRPYARRVAAETRMGHVVNPALRHGEARGYRAVWEFCYGAWTGADDGRPPLPEARAAALAWWRSGVYHRPPDGVPMLGAPEAPTGFDIAELPPPRGAAAQRALPCDAGW